MHDACLAITETDTESRVHIRHAQYKVLKCIKDVVIDWLRIMNPVYTRAVKLF